MGLLLDKNLVTITIGIKATMRGDPNASVKLENIRLDLLSKKWER